jgi:hypothetical protein
MAENKKSFILYADLIHTVDKLPDEIAGKLMKIILNYVNDKNPVIEDILLQVAFEPIRLQLKRDLKEWDITKKDRSDSGKLGNLKKYNKDLYEDVINEKISIQEAESVAKHRRATKAIAKGRTPTNSVANVAVNDNVTVNDNDIIINGAVKFPIEGKFPNMPKMEDVGELPKVKIESAKEQIKITTGQDVTEKQIILYWMAWKKQKLTGEKYYAGLHEVYSHFINCAKKEKFTNQIRAPERQSAPLRTASDYLK